MCEIAWYGKTAPECARKASALRCAPPTRTCTAVCVPERVHLYLPFSHVLARPICLQGQSLCLS